MRLREPFARKHVCAWVLVSNQYDGARLNLVRHCECGLYAEAYVHRDLLTGMPEHTWPFIHGIVWYPCEKPKPPKVTYP